MFKKHWQWLLVILPAGAIIAFAIWWYRKRSSCKKKKEELIKKISEFEEKEKLLSGIEIQSIVAQEGMKQSDKLKEELATLKC